MAATKKSKTTSSKSRATKSGSAKSNGAKAKAAPAPSTKSVKPSLKDQLVGELKLAYRMELETVINYLSNSVHLDGILAQEVKESLKGDINEELGHARQLAERLKILNADVPGSLELTFDQASIQPPADTTDVLSVIKGVIDAEKSAIAQYNKLIELADDADDYVTEDVCVQILAEEQHHLREFEGYYKDLKARPTLR